MYQSRSALRTRFSHLTQELLDATKKLKSTGAEIHQIQTIATQLYTAQTLTLFEQEYIVFCDLIICGCEMATYLSNSPNSSASARRHARYWQKLAKTFKPFLRGALAATR